MVKTVTSIVAALLAVIVLITLIYYLRKIDQSNTVVTMREAELEWQDVKCILCNQYMQQGYVLAGKGINWAPRDSHKPGAFTTIVSTLENTLSMRMLPALNMAWYCKHCKLIVIDNSKMIRIKK